MAATCVVPTTSARPWARSSAPPPAPDRRWRVLLLALLTAVLVLGAPQPFARASWPATGTLVSQAGPGGGRAWPVGGPGGVLRRFDAPPVRWAAGHRGVDLAASPGETVRAAAPGVVSFSGVVAGRPVVTVTHPGSGDPPLRTTYLPVAGSLPPGIEVAAGAAIGELAADDSGHCTGGCLHWGLLRGHRYLDPLALLGSGQARLLPLDHSRTATTAVPGAHRSAVARGGVGLGGGLSGGLSGCPTAWRAAGGRTWCGSG
ncbi:M23 family metallopeptidase [Kitasatospora sp. NPDC002227]|uniref:M23 family metallopeptidase n=1 Tax=Kitasatospora sp. NPDC002227 TaxID=3154773 RepID=UPI00332D281C